VSIPFPSIDGGPDAKFKSVLFLNTCQSAASAISAIVYLYLRRKPGQSAQEMLGLVESTTTSEKVTNGDDHTYTNGHSKHPRPKHPARVAHKRTKALLNACFRTAVLLTLAAPFGFAALSHISYPTMVLGKSCKLVPVMIANVFLYRRKFAAYKYLVVAMVTSGITMFMGFSNEGASKKHTSTELNRNGLLGIAYLLINLALDGVINSTQDEIFSHYKVTGQQMMFIMNLCSTIVTSSLAVLPLPYIPVIHPSDSTQSELAGALEFLRTHPSALGPLLKFALTGAMGQLFIYETLQHFGSLTLVCVLNLICVFPSLRRVTDFCCVFLERSPSPASFSP
jgi:UDP-galactose transporter B1